MPRPDKVHPSAQNGPFVAKFRDMATVIYVEELSWKTDEDSRTGEVNI